MGDRSRGLYNKFVVHRQDGTDKKVGDRHLGCQYFVLDLTHDPHAIPAIRAYAMSAEVDGYVELAKDLRQAAAFATPVKDTEWVVEAVPGGWRVVNRLNSEEAARLIAGVTIVSVTDTLGHDWTMRRLEKDWTVSIFPTEAEAIIMRDALNGR